MTSVASSPLRVARKIVVSVFGFGVLAFGVALIVLPGPAILVIPLGLAILATEYAWARKPLLRMRTLLGRLRVRVRQMLGRPPPPSSPRPKVQQ